MGRRISTRASRAPWLAALLLLAGSCGSSGSGGRGAVVLVGGTLPPNPIAYALTPSSESLIGDDDDTDRPSFVDLRNDGVIPPVQNQRWNSCVAWTLGYYVMTAVEAQRQRVVNKAEFVDVSDPRHWFSPDFIYSQRDDDTTREKVTGAPVHCVERDGELGCMRPEKALRVLVTQGCPKWDWMCDAGSSDRFRSCDVGAQDESLLKSRRDYAPAAPGALRYRPRCFVRFGSLEKLPRDTIDSMKDWLVSQRTPIAIVVKMSAGWVNYRGENRSTIDVGGGFVTDILDERGVCLEAGGQDLLTQHMMTIIGYDDEFPSEEDVPGLPAEKEGSFLVINQWGEKWGDRGTMWIPYSELRKIWIGAYAIIGGDGTGNVNSGVECAQDDEGRWVGIVECDDVPKNLDKAGVPKDTSNALVPMQDPMSGTVRAVHVDEVGHVILQGTCLPAADGGVPRDARDTADWFHFETPGANTRIELKLAGPGGGALSGDLDLRLVDEEQDHIASSLSVGLAGETIRRTLCAAGRYLVKVFPKGGQDSSPYELTLTYRTDAPAQADDELCGATPVTTQALLASIVFQDPAPYGTPGSDANPEDWWKFQADERSTLYVGGYGYADRVEIWTGETPDTAKRVAHAEMFQGALDPLGVRLGGCLVSTELEAGDCAWVRLVDEPDYPAHNGMKAVWATVPLWYQVQHALVPRQGDDSEDGATPLEIDAQGPAMPDGTQVFAGSADPDTVEVGTDVVDWYSLMMPPGGKMVVRIDAPGVANRLDPWINGGTSEPTVRDADSIVLTSVNPPADAQPRLFTIAVFAKQEGVAATLDYTLSVQAFVYPGADTVNFTPADLAELTLGGEVRGVIGGGDPKDHYRAAVPTIDPASPEAWIISVTGFEQSQPPPTVTMALWNGRTVDLVDPRADADISDKEVRLRGVFEPGDAASSDVILGVCAPPGGVFSDYVLRIWRVPVPTPSSDDNDTPPTADPLVAGASQGGSVAADDLLDYYVFRRDPDAVGPGTVSVGLAGVTGVGALLKLSVWDAAGVRRVVNVAQGASGQVQVPGVAPGGVLTILVEALVPQPSTYQVGVSSP